VQRSTLSSPLSHISTSELLSTSTNDVHEQVEKLSKQLSTVIQLTSALEAQHSATQVTIKGLEGKVEALEEVLKTTEEVLVKLQAAKKEVEPTVRLKEKVDNLEGKHYNSLVEMMAKWKTSVEGQWSSVREEWTQERERLAKAWDEFEFKLRHVDSCLQKIAFLQTTLSSQQQQIQAQVQQQQQQLSALNNMTHVLPHLFLHLNSDALKHNGSLVTPPSPRSQSSDSGRYRGRRRRSSGSGSGHFRARSLSGE
jgi:chromosome segregation ATPase